MGIKYNREQMKDKINACWIGKNIGGTLGGPYEGRKEILDVKDFSSEPGEPLVNDDLDLQLVWLRAAEHLGLKSLNEHVLAEYWLTYIKPHWNEYGICKSNMRAGIMPPMSGEIFNAKWKNSNGAWIRTEIWACLFPGQPEEAVKYAYYDACVDHGCAGEGTYAAIFVEALESVAFITSDIWKLLEIGLSKIPETCRVAKSVNIVITEYKKGTDWKTVRNMVVEDSADLGWFQAPANVAFVVLGLLYGECDFKKSMITATNCGDDTDCTAATVGAILGIMYGMEGIPKDWRDFIGDKIISGCLLWGASHGFPTSCKRLTERVMMIQNVNLVGSPVYVGNCDTDFSEVDFDKFMGSDFADSLGKRSPYCIEQNNTIVHALVELDSAPSIVPNGKISGKVTLTNIRRPDCTTCNLRWFADDGFTITGTSMLHIPQWGVCSNEYSVGTFEITAPERINQSNRIVLEISCPGRPSILYVPITLTSK